MPLAATPAGRRRPRSPGPGRMSRESRHGAPRMIKEDPPMKWHLSDRALTACLAASLLALAGCGKSSNITGTGATAQLIADDTAIQTGAAASADKGGMMAEVNGTSDAVPMSRPSAGPLRVSSADTTFTTGNVTITLSRTFYDAGGNELQQWDPSATRARIDSWIRGTVTGPQYQATFGRSGT